MATTKQTKAAKKNIEKAQAAWRVMSPRQHALAQPEGRARAKPGTKGTGEYYRIVVRPKAEFATFRYHAVAPGRIQRLSGKKSGGSWDDQAWLISKEMAHLARGRLVADAPAAQNVLDQIGPAKHVKGDVFQGHPRRNVPESEKPTPAQRRAQLKNIRRAQKARWK